MDQGGHGRRAGHRIRQPGLQRELCRLADRTAEQQQGDRGDLRAAEHKVLPRQQNRLLNVERAEVAIQPEEADRHQGIAHPGDDEGLARRRAIGRILVPEADQQVAAQADPFPAEEQEEQVVAQNEEQHARDE